LRRENVVYFKKEEGEEIKGRHDKRKKFLCRLPATIVCIM